MKNDWGNGDNGTRSAMNQPFWLASGTVGGTGDGAGVVRVFLSPGSMRFPNRNPIFSGTALQSFSFGPTPVNFQYAVFVRSTGNFMVSGAPIGVVPDPPRWDAEYLGRVVTGSGNTTANLSGPWNGGNLTELRGQYVAITATRPRVVYHQVKYGSVNGIINNSHTGETSSSGIAYLSMDDATPHGSVFANTSTLLNASVTYLVSGATTTGANVMVGFSIWKGENSSGSGGTSSSLALQYQTVPFTISQNPYPFPPAAGTQIFQSFTMQAINPSPTAIGYGFGAYIVPNPYTVTGGDGSASIQIVSVAFTACPGMQGSDTNEPV